MVCHRDGVGYIINAQAYTGFGVRSCVLYLRVVYYVGSKFILPQLV